MRKINLVLGLIMTLTTALTQVSFACDIHGKTGILPENNLNIPVGLKSLEGGITEAQFNKVINRVAKLYSPVVRKLGGTLTFNRNWTDGTVNAYANRENDTGNVWFVSMFGGLARHPQMNEDGFAVVVCHELGHHLGGAPRKTDPATGLLRWAANEGQADYYATLKCLRNYFANQNNQKYLKTINVPTAVSNSCESSFSNANEIATCERSAMAGLTLGNFFKALMNTADNLDFSTPDSRKVSVTFDAHPQPQCRLDTYFQGSLCDKSLQEDTSATDVNIGSCTARNGDTVGLRPACWYAVPN